MIESGDGGSDEICVTGAHCEFLKLCQRLRAHKEALEVLGDGSRIVGT